MKKYSVEEKAEAQKKLAKPVLDFLFSPTLTAIYVGIQKKHSLDFRQLVLFCDIVNATLMGLEPESAVETNLHQAMHELSNEKARELVADTNDRIFKEAKRRLQENVLEPSVWSESINEPELTQEERIEKAKLEKIENMADDDPELLKAYERDEAAEKERQRIEQEEVEAGLKEEVRQSALEENVESVVRKTEEPEAKDTTSILEQKLGMAVQIKPVEVAVQKIESPERRAPSAEPEKPPKQELIQKVPPLSVQISKKLYSDGVDPYREPIE